MTMLKPWREVAVPHADVLNGTFQQSEFAADLMAVRAGRAPVQYQDAGEFFKRTFITEGMRLLLTQVARRLTGQGGDPVIQLQTAFGGGKTHSMMAVYHLARRVGPVRDLAGIAPLLDQAGLGELPAAQVAVLDGNAYAPNQPWTRGGATVRTLWGELAWELGCEDGYAMVRGADESGTAPGKEVLRDLLARFAPCVVLIDELVAYVRQFADERPLSGGTYDSNLSFVQQLTEAAKLVPTAMVLASLPESEVEAGSARGAAALKLLERDLVPFQQKGVEKSFARVQALWRAVTTDEAFEIVRRRLFEPIADTATRDAVCQAFATAYEAEGARLPPDTHEARYLERMTRAYPIHPEVFDRLYGTWSALPAFQRTRGVLKLMAHVVHRLWSDQNADLMVMPGSLPLSDARTATELTSYLSAGWDPVIERDVDGPHAEPTLLDQREPRFGAVHAARRVARTLFFATAPSSVASAVDNRGEDRARVLLGCLQPGQASALYSDALNRVVDRSHHLSSSGDKTSETTRYWFDTHTNLRREMEARRDRVTVEDVSFRDRLRDAAKELFPEGGAVDRVHPFRPHADVPDSELLQLVILPLEVAYSKQTTAPATEAVLEFVRRWGPKARERGNRLIFIAADQGAAVRVREAISTAVAWASIVEDIKKKRLVVTNVQGDQAATEKDLAERVVPRAARECFKWLLAPTMHSPTDREIVVEAHQLNTGGGSAKDELARVCQEEVVVISRWAPVHLRKRLADLYWKPGTPAVPAGTVWRDMQRYLYLERLRNRAVLEQVVAVGTESRDFFGTAHGQVGDRFEGFKLGTGTTSVDDTLLLIEPGAAAAYEAAQAGTPPAPGGATPSATAAAPGRARRPTPPATPAGSGQPVESRPHRFIGSVPVNAATARVLLTELAENVIEHLAQDPSATVTVTVEIHAEFPGGVSNELKRTVSENAAALRFRPTWE